MYFFTLNYGFLNAKSALIVVIFEIFRDFLYLKFKKRNNIFIICLPFYIIISIITYENIISTLSIIESIFDSYALTKKNQKVVALSIITYTFWLIYDINFESYSTVFFESIIILSNIIVLIKYRNAYLRSDKLIFSRGLVFNTKIINDFYKIDSNNFDSIYRWTKEKHTNVIKSKKTEFIFIKDKKEIVGYINFINITKNKYLEMQDDSKYNDIHRKDILIFNKNNDNYININTISIKNEYQNKKSIIKIANVIKKYLHNKKINGFIIKGIIAITASNFERDILSYMNLKKISKNNDNFSIFIFEDL